VRKKQTETLIRIEIKEIPNGFANPLSLIQSGILTLQRT